MTRFFQICSQLSERLEKQQAANRGELEKIRVNATLTHWVPAAPELERLQVAMATGLVWGRWR